MVRTTRTTTKASPREEADLLESREVLPGRGWQTWRAPTIARSLVPGQYLYLHHPRPAGLLLPALPVAGFDRVAGTVSVLLDDSVQGGSLATARAGETARFEGPLGRGFAIDARSRFLLVVTDATGFARVRAIADEAVASGRQVTVLLEAPSVAAVFPSSLLPDEAEYVVATSDGSLGHRGSARELLPAYEAWADQCFAAGSAELLGTLARAAAGRDQRMGVARLGRRRNRRSDPRDHDRRRRAWLQLALPHPVGCALGVCAGCVTAGREGHVRICREGPAFASDELHWATGS